ncbi:hypothetical protein ACIQVE_20405 [Pseudomonas sp. NPDC098747]|uniref:hypothetical protein n=1 Tax=Pseudomonas sp. NPDC098747 TaxID=3364487 RepID=UPI00383A0728
MSVYKRYFRITEGPMVDEIARLQDLRSDTADAFRVLGDQYGAEDVFTWPRTGAFAGFKFPKGSKPDEKLFRLMKKERLWIPRKTGAGKAIWPIIERLPQVAPVENALHLVGLTPNVPSLVHHGRWYSPQLWGFGSPINVWFVSVPWLDVDPAELAQYQIDRAAGTHYDGNFEHLSWSMPKDWFEVKEWQVLKESEELSKPAGDNLRE